MKPSMGKTWRWGTCFSKMDFKIGWLVELPYNLLGKQTFSQKWPFLCCYFLVNDAFKMVFLRMWNEGTGKDQVSFYMLVARASFARAFLGAIDQSMRWQYWAKKCTFFKVTWGIFPMVRIFPIKHRSSWQYILYSIGICTNEKLIKQLKKYSKYIERTCQYQRLWTINM